MITKIMTVIMIMRVIMMMDNQSTRKVSPGWRRASVVFRSRPANTIIIIIIINIITIIITITFIILIITTAFIIWPTQIIDDDLTIMPGSSISENIRDCSLSLEIYKTTTGLRMKVIMVMISSRWSLWSRWWSWSPAWSWHDVEDGRWK